MNLKLIALVYIALSLVGCSTHQGMLKSGTVFKIDGGGTISLPISREGAPPTENDDYKMTFAGASVAPKKGDPDNSEVSWAFSFFAKSNLQIQSVTVEQVTETGELIPVVQDTLPNLNNKRWAGESKPYLMSRAISPWLYSNNDSTFLFKLTIVHLDAPTVVMYQPSLITRAAKSAYLKLIND